MFIIQDSVALFPLRISFFIKSFIDQIHGMYKRLSKLFCLKKAKKKEDRFTSRCIRLQNGQFCFLCHTTAPSAIMQTLQSSHLMKFTDFLSISTTFCKGQKSFQILILIKFLMKYYHLQNRNVSKKRVKFYRNLQNVKNIPEK